ncbi:MAG: nitroreductase family protein [Clostridia bacterium]|nr:nitroreductase family protein [Clostridia bacterium]
MNFLELAKSRQSCRSYDKGRYVEPEKIDAILEAARLSPSACNAQPYSLWVCTGSGALKIAEATGGMGMNKFAKDAPVMIVISEAPYNATAKIGAKVKHNDYRSIDIGILSAYITAEAESQGLGSCIIGWFDNAKICEAIGRDVTVRLVISIGYAKDEVKREKRRKPLSELVSFVTGDDKNV